MKFAATAGAVAAAAAAIKELLNLIPKTSFNESNDGQGQQRIEDSLLALHTAFERFQSCIEIQTEKLKTYAFSFTFVLIMFFGYIFWSHSVNEREKIQLELEYQQMFQMELVQQQMAQMEFTHQQIIEMKFAHQQQIYVIAIFSFVGIVVSFFFGALVAWIIKK
uniref:Uncharacterized protein n=1 Tax=Panagrolaimus davidi TaxID=227884 RepID=A0A914QI38_9BILA